MCVTLGIIGILLDFSGLLFCFVSQQGSAVGILEVTAQRRHFKFAVICNLDADCTYLHFPFLNGMRLSPERQDMIPK